VDSESPQSIFQATGQSSRAPIRERQTFGQHLFVETRLDHTIWPAEKCFPNKVCPDGADGFADHFGYEPLPQIGKAWVEKMETEELFHFSFKTFECFPLKT
jgi:hypothetical protein